MIAWTLLLLLLSAWFSWALHRDLERAVARQRTRARLRQVGRMAGVSGTFLAAASSMAQAVRAASEFEQSMSRVRHFVNDAPGLDLEPWQLEVLAQVLADRLERP